MRFSIRYQLLLPLLALMLGLVGVSVWNAWSAGQRAREQIETQIDKIGATVHAVSFPLNMQTLQLMKGLSGAEFMVSDDDGNPRSGARSPQISTLPEVPQTLPPADEYPPRLFDMPVQVGKYRYLCGAWPLRQGSRTGTTLYILFPESLWRDAVWQALQPALTLGIVGSVVSIVLSVFLMQRLTRRIQELERRTRLIAEGDFSPMTLPGRNDELRDLGCSVNDMAQRLTQFQDAVRRNERLRLLGQVSGGLAHQLRNGVAGARLAVQLHAQECSLPGDTEALTVALRQLSIVEMHLKRFFDLGKAVELNRQPCRMDDLVRETVELLGPQCRHARIDLRIVPPESTAVALFGDCSQLGHLMLNVVSNAIEAAGPGGWVELRWGQTSRERAYMDVRDSGPGPAPEIAQRLFEPFVTGKPEGVGLGLAVARQVVEAHGGTIGWQRLADSTCFRIELPCIHTSLPTPSGAVA